jgi:hypothetical protein
MLGLISVHECHLEHTPHALDLSWSSESLWLITPGDRHHLDDSVAIGARWSSQRICWWPDSIIICGREGPTAPERQMIIFHWAFSSCEDQGERYFAWVFQRGLVESVESQIHRGKNGGVFLSLIYIPHLLWSIYFVYLWKGIRLTPSS